MPRLLSTVFVVIAVFLAVASCAHFTVQAGQVSVDGNWILRSYHPLTAAGFSIEQGDSITFVVGGYSKAIIISDRLFFALIDDDTGAPNSILDRAANNSITVTETNATYSSGLLNIGETFTVLFDAPGTYGLFDIMSGDNLPSIVVTPTGTPATYSPALANQTMLDSIDKDEAAGFEASTAATDASGLTGVIRLGYQADPNSYNGFVGGNPVSVVRDKTLTFRNQDTRVLNVFINTSNVFEPSATELFGGSVFWTPSGSSIGAAGLFASSGLLYPGQSFTVTFTALGTYTWHSTIGGYTGNITVVKPPPQLRALSGGRAFAAFIIVIAILLLIVVIGCIVIIVCKYSCIEAKRLEAKAEQSFRNLHLTDDL